MLGEGDVWNIGKQCWRAHGLYFWMRMRCGLSCGLFFFFFFFFLLAVSHLVCFDYHSAKGMQQDLLADGEWETKMHLHTQPACLHTEPWSMSSWIRFWNLSFNVAFFKLGLSEFFPSESIAQLSHIKHHKKIWSQAKGIIVLSEDWSFLLQIPAECSPTSNTDALPWA